MIQQLDRKINDSVSALAQRLGENYRSLDSELNIVAGQTDKTLTDTHKRLEQLTDEVSRWIVQVGALDRRCESLNSPVRSDLTGALDAALSQTVSPCSTEWTARLWMRRRHESTRRLLRL
eukprot:SAG11_NODE_1443_length_4894_cov_20.162044_2_plen_120_part_00